VAVANGVIMTPTELKVIRKAFNLKSVEVAKIFNRSQRAVLFWESGKNGIPDNVDQVFRTMRTRYMRLSDDVSSDIKQGLFGGYPKLPIFVEHEDFVEYTNNHDFTDWLIWQRVVQTLYLQGAIEAVDEPSNLPTSSKTFKWLTMHKTIPSVGDIIHSTQ